MRQKSITFYVAFRSDEEKSKSHIQAKGISYTDGLNSTFFVFPRRDNDSIRWGSAQFPKSQQLVRFARVSFVFSCFSPPFGSRNILMDSDPDLEIIEKDSGMSSLGGSKDETPERRAIIVSELEEWRSEFVVVGGVFFFR